MDSCQHNTATWKSASLTIKAGDDIIDVTPAICGKMYPSPIGKQHEIKRMCWWKDSIFLNSTNYKNNGVIPQVLKNAITSHL